MAGYVGLQKQINSNNRKSILLLIGFPALILATVYAVIFFANFSGDNTDYDAINQSFLLTVPVVLGAVAIWFLIAYAFNAKMINMATGAKPLERKENMRVYNLVENLCMSKGMTMPKVYIIETDALNAYASGLNQKSYAVTLTRGIIDKLDDDELEGVIAHELTHIQNKDVKLLIISIIFVGIFSFIVQVAFRSVLYGNRGRSNNKKGNGQLMLIILIASVVAYLLSMVFKFALSRKREYLADAGAAEMTRNPRALASALRKISGHSKIESIKSDDVKQLFIDNGSEKKKSFSGLSGLFATHPPIDKRIEVLEQF